MQYTSILVIFFHIVQIQFTKFFQILLYADIVIVHVITSGVSVSIWCLGIYICIYALPEFDS